MPGIPTIPYIPGLFRHADPSGPPVPPALRMLAVASILVGLVQTVWMAISLVLLIPLGPLTQAASAAPTTGPASTYRFVPPSVKTPTFEVPDSLPIGVRPDPTPATQPVAPRDADPGLAYLPPPTKTTYLSPPPSASSRGLVLGMRIAHRVAGLGLAAMLLAAGAVTLARRPAGVRLHLLYGFGRLGLSLLVVGLFGAAIALNLPLDDASSSSNPQTMWNEFFLLLAGAAVSFFLSFVYPIVVLFALQMRSARAYRAELRQWQAERDQPVQTQGAYGSSFRRDESR